MIEQINLVAAAGALLFLAAFASAGFRVMLPVFRYAYSNARLSAMEARCISLSRMREVAAQKNTAGAIDALSSTDYGGIKDVNSKNAESVLNNHIVSHITDVRKFCPRSATKVFDYYMREWEIYNILNALRISEAGVSSGRDDMKTNFADVPAFGYDRMAEIVSENEDSAFEKLKGTQYYAVISEYLEKHSVKKSAGILESMFDRYNLTKLYDDAEHGGKINGADASAIREFAKLKADILNIVAASRLATGNVKKDEYRELIPLGFFISSKKREELSRAVKIEDVGAALSGTPYAEDFNNGLNEFRKSGRVEAIAKRLDDVFMEYVRHGAQVHMFSVAAIIRYMETKKREALLLRSILKGIADGVEFEIDDGMRVVEKD